MKSTLRRLAWRLAPNAMAYLADIGDVRAGHGSLLAAIQQAEARLAELEASRERFRRDLELQQRDLDQLRVDARHTAELYDLVFERARDR
jgi:multidrug resistance efflux pump